jgi:hypothetical protein
VDVKINKHSFFFTEILYGEPDQDRYEHYRAEWGLELGDRVAVNMWAEDVFGTVCIIAKGQSATSPYLGWPLGEEECL